MPPSFDEKRIHRDNRKGPSFMKPFSLMHVKNTQPYRLAHFACTSTQLTANGGNNTRFGIPRSRLVYQFKLKKNLALRKCMRYFTVLSHFVSLLVPDVEKCILSSTITTMLGDITPQRTTNAYM